MAACAWRLKVHSESRNAERFYRRQTGETLSCQKSLPEASGAVEFSMASVSCCPSNTLGLTRGAVVGWRAARLCRLSTQGHQRGRPPEAVVQQRKGIPEQGWAVQTRAQPSRWWARPTRWAPAAAVRSTMVQRGARLQHGAASCLSRSAAGRLAPSDLRARAWRGARRSAGRPRAVPAGAASGMALEPRLRTRVARLRLGSSLALPHCAAPPLPLHIAHPSHPLPSAPQDGTGGAAAGEEVAPAETMSKNPQDQFMDVVDKAQASIPPEKYAKKVRGRPLPRATRRPPAARAPRAPAARPRAQLTAACAATGTRRPLSSSTARTLSAKRASIWSSGRTLTSSSYCASSSTRRG